MTLCYLLALIARVEIVSATDQAVTYRELVPARVAADPQAGLVHEKGCPQITPAMQWIAPAAATLHRYVPHSCPVTRQVEYATHTEARAPRSPNVISVLFLGNSLTYFNQMPRMTQKIGARESKPLRTDAVTRSGITLEQVWLDTDARKRIWQEHWDYVVIQEQGTRAHRQNDVFQKYLGLLASEARRSGAQPLLYMTWIHGPANNEAIFKDAAKRTGARLVPAGSARDDLVRQGLFKQLDDGAHPNLAGSYLVACAVFATIYGKPAHGAPHDFRELAVRSEFYDAALLEQTLSAEQARWIQTAAWNAVRRSGVVQGSDVPPGAPQSAAQRNP